MTALGDPHAEHLNRPTGIRAAQLGRVAGSLLPCAIRRAFPLAYGP